MKTSENKERNTNLSDQQGKKRKLAEHPGHDTIEPLLEEYLEEENQMELALTVAHSAGFSHSNNQPNVAGFELEEDDGDVGTYTCLDIKSLMDLASKT